MTETLRKYEMLSPLTNNELTDPMEFNLMFSTSIGPSGLIKGFVSTTPNPNLMLAHPFKGFFFLLHLTLTSCF